tara:strand:+ start:1596 stop:1784 length:189 start_codon:yes stop_codon:yes gene_type:complete
MITMTKVKCRFCGTIHTIDVKGAALKRLRKGPPTPCQGNTAKLAPRHLENVFSWDEHYEILD